MNDQTSEVTLLRHFTAALDYRTRKALDGAPAGYATFSPGKDVRTPVEILVHMGDVLSFAVKKLRGDESPRPPRLTSPGWNDERQRFRAILGEFDSVLAGVDTLQRETALRLLQGPLADAMTHAGQLAMLRRLCDAPIPPENFFAAHIGEV